MPPILYSFRRCPYAMRARLAIYASGVRVEIREVLLRDKPPELLAISPQATVPVLQHGTHVLTQSLDIMLWALTQNDPRHLLHGDFHSLIAENDGAFKKALDGYKYPQRYPHATPEEHRQ